MKISTAGINLAKNLMQVHGADELGRAVLRNMQRAAPGVWLYP
jgi:hypothetical protein